MTRAATGAATEAAAGAARRLIAGALVWSLSGLGAAAQISLKNSCSDYLFQTTHDYAYWRHAAVTFDGQAGAFLVDRDFGLVFSASHAFRYDTAAGRVQPDRYAPAVDQKFRVIHRNEAADFVIMLPVGRNPFQDTDAPEFELATDNGAMWPGNAALNLRGAKGGPAEATPLQVRDFVLTRMLRSGDGAECAAPKAPVCCTEKCLQFASDHVAGDSGGPVYAPTGAVHAFLTSKRTNQGHAVPLALVRADVLSVGRKLLAGEIPGQAADFPWLAKAVAAYERRRATVERFIDDGGAVPSPAGLKRMMNPQGRARISNVTLALLLDAFGIAGFSTGAGGTLSDREDLVRILACAGFDRGLSASADQLAAANAVRIASGPAPDPGVIRVGIIHSLSGSMAAAEAPLSEAMLFLIDRQNRRGGLLGRRLVPVVADPASDWPLFAQKAERLSAAQRVDVVFGGRTTVSRKSMLPVFEAQNAILFYPARYEGEESQRNLFYTGAVPNQNAIPAAEWLAQTEGVERWALVGTDHVYARVTNRILSGWLRSRGVAAADIMTSYRPFGFAEWDGAVEEIRRFAEGGGRTAVLSTVTGADNAAFYAALARQEVSPRDIPVMALALEQADYAGPEDGAQAGRLVAGSYFPSVDLEASGDFDAAWREYRSDDSLRVDEAIEAQLIGFSMWAKAVEAAGTTAADAVIDAMVGVSVPNLTGGLATMLPNHHITKPLLIGEMTGKGEVAIIHRSAGLIAGDAWSDYLPESAGLISDWRSPVRCGDFDVRSGKCGRAGQ